MEQIVFERMAEQDERHWWYRARREILETLIRRRIARECALSILEVGCGTGHNLAMLSGFGAVDAVEIDDGARAIATKRLGRAIGDARLPELKGVSEGAYDLVAMLEHIEDDCAALASIARRLTPTGKILITVPAGPWMWSAHDVVHHHFRRYSRRSLEQTIGRSGLLVEHIGYFNSLLYPAAAAARLWGKLSGRQDSDDAMPAVPLNALFERIFRLERHLVGRVALPIGISLFAIVTQSHDR